MTTFLGTSANDLRVGGAGNDYVSLYAGDDTAWGEGGSDRIYGGTGADRLYGGAQNDLLYGGNQADGLSGGSGDDMAYGGSGEDLLIGGDGNDWLSGQSQADVLRGGNQADEIYGGSGDDSLYGDAGDDTLFADDGSDSLYGGNGHDRISAMGDGLDQVVLDGGAGNDLILSFAESSIATTGAGRDVYFFGYDGETDCSHLLLDFTPGQDRLAWDWEGSWLDPLDTNDNGTLDDGDAFVEVENVAYLGVAKLSTVIDIGGWQADAPNVVTLWGTVGVTAGDLAGYEAIL